MKVETFDIYEYDKNAQKNVKVETLVLNRKYIYFKYFELKEENKVHWRCMNCYEEAITESLNGKFSLIKGE